MIEYTIAFYPFPRAARVGYGILEVLMKKRLLCLILGLVMIIPVALTGCGNKQSAEADINSSGAKTITLRIISEKKVCNTDEELADYLANECGGDKESQKYLDMLATMKAYEDVEDEISKVTKANYKTNVDILFYTEDEYYELMEKSMEEYATEQKNAERAQRALDFYIKEYQAYDPNASEASIKKAFYKYFPEYQKYENWSSQDASAGGQDEYVENEYGIKELVYPEAGKNQLDIIYLSGRDMYMKYIENEWILGLNSHINTTGKKLTYNISATLLNGVRVDGETYAIPNNVQIGEYTYMLVDKKLADKYRYTYDSFENLTDCRFFVEDVYSSETGILPINATFEECMNLFVWYWNIDYQWDKENMVFDYSINKDNDFSVIGALYGDPQNAGRGKFELSFNNLFENPEYRELLLCLKEYDINKCYVNNYDSEIKDYAIDFVEGTYAMKRMAEENNGVYTDENGREYYLYVAKYPMADEESLYGNMFAVSANTKNTQACMEVITLLNTDPYIKNLLQYGIKQGEHRDGQTPNYFIDEDTGVLTRLNNLYMMDGNKTGNCFIGYAEEGLPANYWEDAKAQNNEALIDPLLGFDMNERLAQYGAKLDNDQLKNCKEFSGEIWENIDMCTTYSDLESLINNTLVTTVGKGALQSGALVNIKMLTNNAYVNESGDGESPYTVYYEWLKEMEYLPTATLQ